MKTIVGDLWDGWPEAAVVITVNHTVNSKGHLVMGRGVAKQATDKIPDLAWIAASSMQWGPGQVHWLPESRVFLFPVKDHWRDKADSAMVEDSLAQLREYAEQFSELEIRMPMVGAGFGELPGDIVMDMITCVGMPNNVTLVLRGEGVETKYPESFKPGARKDRS